MIGSSPLFSKKEYKVIGVWMDGERELITVCNGIDSAKYEAMNSVKIYPEVHVENDKGKLLLIYQNRGGKAWLEKEIKD